MLAQDDTTATVPNHHGDQARDIAGGADRLVQRGGVAPVRPQADMRPHGGGDLGQGDWAANDPGGRHLARSVDQKRDTLKVSPRPGVRVFVEVVPGPRDELDVTGPPRPVPRQDPSELPRGEAARLKGSPHRRWSRGPRRDGSLGGCIGAVRRAEQHDQGGGGRANAPIRRHHGGWCPPAGPGQSFPAARSHGGRRSDGPPPGGRADTGRCDGHPDR
jgi:hypothetical protein